MSIPSIWKNFNGRSSMNSDKSVLSCEFAYLINYVSQKFWFNVFKHINTA